MDLGVVAGVVAIGIVHGVLPDHGWPIAAAYALTRPRRWLYGTVAGLILGIGHLISSVVLVLAYYWVSGFAAFAEGPWLRYVAGALLVFLGVREYRHGGHAEQHGHHGDDEHDHPHRDQGDGHEHHEHHEHRDHDEHDENDEHDEDDDRDRSHGHDHGYTAASEANASPENGFLARVRARFPGGRDGTANAQGHSHAHLTEDDAERGLVALGTTALLLGFAHEEPIQILAICVGTPFCLELMLVYSLAVIVAILVPTLLLIAGYERHRETVERYTPYLPVLTATVLVGMGFAFIVGVF